MPVVIVQFQDDVFCNRLCYSKWYSEFAVAENVDHSDAPGQEKGWVFFLDVPGKHADAERLATMPDVENFNNLLSNVWNAFWLEATK